MRSLLTKLKASDSISIEQRAQTKSWSSKTFRFASHKVSFYCFTIAPMSHFQAHKVTRNEWMHRLTNNAKNAIATRSGLFIWNRYAGPLCMLPSEWLCVQLCSTSIKSNYVWCQKSTPDSRATILALPERSLFGSAKIADEPCDAHKSRPYHRYFFFLKKCEKTANVYENSMFLIVYNHHRISLKLKISE